MTPFRSLLTAAALSLAATAALAVDAETQANAEAINAACEVDAEKSGCTGKTVGSGLVKCITDYKKAHPEFKLTEGCKAASAKGWADYKASQGAAP